MPEARTYQEKTAMLVHGAWAGGWVWDAITPYLEQQGFQVLAPDLAGCGPRLGDPLEASLGRCVADLMRQLQDIEGPLLTGHVPQVAAPQTIANILNALWQGAF
ncbi:MAG: alpha/beta hydrolase [Marinobacter sp.]